MCASAALALGFPGDFRNHASPSRDSLSSFHNVHFEGGLNHFTRN